MTDHQSTVTVPNLILRHTNAFPTLGVPQPEDYDVFDGDHEIGRIYQVKAFGGETWFWGVSFKVAKRKCYGYAMSLAEANAAFRAEYQLNRRNILSVEREN